MKKEQIVVEAQRIIRDAWQADKPIGPLAQARELVRTTAGERSAFFKALQDIQQGWSVDFAAKHIESALTSFIAFLNTGLVGGVSIERRAQIDVVSDILGQAQQLLDTKGVHPASAAMLIGAALEEFLRNWGEEAGLSIGNRREGIDAYATALREAELITKQDVKDITSWAGVRNHAAHGEWEAVGEASRVRLMLEGVNLFMRRYGSA